MASEGSTRRGSYSEQEIEPGLQAVAFFSGDTRRAAKELKRLGHPVPRTTLRDADPVTVECSSAIPPRGRQL